MTFPHNPQPGPRPGPPPGGFRPVPQPPQGQPPHGQPPQGQRWEDQRWEDQRSEGQQSEGQQSEGQRWEDQRWEGRPGEGPAREVQPAQPATYAEPGERRVVETTGHPAVDAALRSLANASQLAPGEQIAAYEAAHQVLQETLSSIEG